MNHRAEYGTDFVNLMPTNLYARGDNYHPNTATSSSR
jgi:GDP-L-fucose synthase